jgi:hypothetical protein
MRLILIIICIFLFFKKSEGFCEDLNENQICKFINIKLPIEKNFTQHEIKNYGESRGKDIYNELFNKNNPRISDAISNKQNVESYILDICYIHKSFEVDGILIVLNTILKETYNNLEPVKSTDTIKKYFSKLLFLRYRFLNKIFDEENKSNNLLKKMNMKMIKFHIFYLLLEETNLDYINSNLRLGICSYLYNKNTFIISKDEDNNIYQHLLLIIIDVINKYIYDIYHKEYDNIEDLTIKQVSNIIINGELIDYFQVKKDLCYI